LAAAAALALLAALGFGAAVLWFRHESRDVRGSSTVEFVTTDVPQPPPAPRRARRQQTVVWPTYGFDARRIRVAPSSRLQPPFRSIWTFHGRQLLEFPPAIAYGRLFLPTFNGRLYALDATTGRVAWRYTSGRCSWASPAVAHGLVIATFLSRGPHCEGDTFHPEGVVVAFEPRTGRIRWRHAMGVTESSPLVVGGLVVVGDWTGRVVALHVRNGKTRWSYATGGRVKSSAAAAGGRVVMGSYDGHLYALDVRTGRLLWRASSQLRFGGRGQFYSTPALAYGRVFVGSTDGKVYAFGLTSGKLRWSHGTGGYVYGSPAVWRKLVFVGSYDHSFYAFDAATGDIRWRFAANGPISGSATVLNGVVYFSTLAQRTYALDARTGRLRWTFADGKYSPVVADSRRLYLVGYGRIYGMLPRRVS
jgi:outer membrane protein assembly factor BamB